MNETFLQIAMVFLKAVAGELDPYTSIKSEIKRTGETEVTMFTPAHIQFARYGRGPGKKPPLDNILQFVKKNGIIFDGQDEKGTAFAIQNSISIKGTSNWVPNAPNALQEAINNEQGDYFKSLNIELMKEEDKEVEKAIEKAFPKDIKFKM